MYFATSIYSGGDHIGLDRCHLRKAGFVANLQELAQWCCPAIGTTSNSAIHNRWLIGKSNFVFILRRNLVSSD